MRVPSLYVKVRAAFSAAALIVTTVLLVFMIVFTEFDVHWVTFLAGILVAATLSLASRAARADRTAEERSAKVLEVQDRLAQEVQRREAAESRVAGSDARLQMMDNDLPTMIAFVDREGIYRYHNRAFREGLRLKAEQLTGAFMRDVLGGKLYGEVAAHVRSALSGEAVRFSRAGGQEGWFLPTFTKKGVVEGFFEVASSAPGPADPGPLPSAPGEASDPAGNDLSLYVEAFSETVTGQAGASDRIVLALENDAFALLCQTVAPLGARTSVNHFEIFVRLLEEEDKLMPPGAFFPLAEKYGLLPRLDRWVVQHVVEWLSHRAPTTAWSRDSIFFINVARSTLADPEFPEFVAAQLRSCEVPGKTLCFEVSEFIAAAEHASVVQFAAAVRRAGCGLALSGFGRENVSFDGLREFKADFVKIDGMVVLGMLRNNVYLARIAALARVAKAIGVRTVAELVESREITEKLRELGVDFAQGLGIAPPVALRDLESRKV